MEKFKKLFEKYGYTVEKVGEDSYIADNGTYCVPYTEYVMYGNNYLCGVSFLSCDKDALKEAYKDTKIGNEVYSDWMNDTLDFHHFGRIGNHDHSLFEIENAIRN